MEDEQVRTIKYNRMVQNVIKDAGYDSLSYKAIEGKKLDPEGDWESIILFDNPMRSRSGSKGGIRLPPTEDDIKGIVDAPHGSKSSVVWMTPDEYISKTAEGFNTLDDVMYKQLRSEGKDPTIAPRETAETMEISRKGTRANEYEVAMEQGDQFPMGMLDYSGGNEYPFSQEGLHRAVAAKQRGDKYIPVMVIGTKPKSERFPKKKRNK